MSKENTRQSGYYWVKCGGLWTIHPYSEQGWVFPNIGSFEKDEYWDEINENRILSPDEGKVYVGDDAWDLIEDYADNIKPLDEKDYYYLEDMRKKHVVLQVVEDKNK